MTALASAVTRLPRPWLDKKGRFHGLRAAVFALLLLPLLPDAARASWERSCFWVSMKAMVGPARTAWFARSRTLLLRGCMSLVTKSATGPSIPSGTMHWSNGRGMDVGMPPTSIWQNRP